MLDLETSYLLCKDIVIRGVGNKYWALDVKNGSQYKLNSTSYTILNCLRERKKLKEIINIVKKEYVVDEERIVNDCNVVIPFAIEKNIIKEVQT